VFDSRVGGGIIGRCTWAVTERPLSTRQGDLALPICVGAGRCFRGALLADPLPTRSIHGLSLLTISVRAIVTGTCGEARPLDERTHSEIVDRDSGPVPHCRRTVATHRPCEATHNAITVSAQAVDDARGIAGRLARAEVGRGRRASRRVMGRPLIRLITRAVGSATGVDHRISQWVSPYDIVCGRE
jgi:hypothetical protein